MSDKPQPSGGTRTVTWQDPSIAASAMARLDGMEWLAALKSGQLPRPPMAVMLGYQIVDFGRGWATFHMEDGQWLYNPIGMIHGGALTTMMDSAMGCAVHSILPRGGAYSTIEFKVNFVHPVKSGVGTIISRGRLIHGGKRIATAEADVKDAEGNLYAHAVTTCMLFLPK